MDISADSGSSHSCRWVQMYPVRRLSWKMQIAMSASSIRVTSPAAAGCKDWTCKHGSYLKRIGHLHSCLVDEANIRRRVNMVDMGGDPEDLRRQTLQWEPPHQAHRPCFHHFAPRHCIDWEWSHNDLCVVIMLHLPTLEIWMSSLVMQLSWRGRHFNDSRLTNLTIHVINILLSSHHQKEHNRVYKEKKTKSLRKIIFPLPYLPDRGEEEIILQTSITSQ